MAQIVTLTLSPALDRATSVAHLHPDDKLRCSEPRYAPGGGGINVARAIHRLGGNALAVFPAGGPTGQHLTELLADEGIQGLSVPIHSWTRECFHVVEQAHGQQYRFVLPGATLSQPEQDQLLQRLAVLPAFDYLVISGSHPAGLAEDFLPCLLQLARQHSARCILDSSGAALRQAMDIGNLFLLKPSLDELSALTGEHITDSVHLASVARSLIDSGRCQALLVSLGPQGALLATNGRIERIPAPTVRKVSTVGAGDSMVGALTYKLATGACLLEAARYGVAAGSSAAMAEGTELCSLVDTERLFGWICSHAGDTVATD